MHELSITRNIVALVSERAGDRPVRSIVLAIGALSGIDADAIRFCFPICAEGTPLASAELRVEHVGARGRCQSCGQERALDGPVLRCDCAERGPIQVIAGEELLIRSMEVAHV